MAWRLLHVCMPVCKLTHTHTHGIVHSIMCIIISNPVCADKAAMKTAMAKGLEGRMITLVFCVPEHL